VVQIHCGGSYLPALVGRKKMQESDKIINSKTSYVKTGGTVVPIPCSSRGNTTKKLFWCFGGMADAPDGMTMICNF